ncbi:hypothetical protein Tsubulata_012568 [Turnera subulata]|uniref:LisH domain-containing protein n=1 Tax=Turnera subulata TaxID=218843 RepID=A0A9Q0FND1_9ROSI|nr:hypothetical protein Tsubulata_012568 [Turnera subulata]
MGKQTKSKKTEQAAGKRKVTPVQIAFIVDRYLADNNFSQTRTAFRNEASSLISKSPVREAPKSLLSLEAMLEEYISLKEQKVILDQERARLEHEKSRVNSLLQGMQEVMNVYNAGATVATASPMIQGSATRPPAATATATATAAALLPAPSTGSPAGYPAYMSPSAVQLSSPSNTIMEHTNLPSSISSQPLTRKRVYPNATTEALSVAKKSRGKVPVGKKPSKGTCNQSNNAATTQKNAQPSPMLESSPINCTSGPLALGSTVAKNLFNQPLPYLPTSSSGPNTPPQAISPKNDQSISPIGNSSIAQGSNNNTPQGITPTNCTVITSERVMVSPCKHKSYYLERSHCISTNSPVKTTLKRIGMRDNVKGRLDFDGSDATMSLDKPNVDMPSTSEANKDGDIFDMDLPNLDELGPNFSFSQLLLDLGIELGGTECPCQPVVDASPDTTSGSSQESRDSNPGDQVLSEFTSTVTEVISETDQHEQGTDALTAVKSITKCVKILSPAKDNRIPMDQ